MDTTFPLTALVVEEFVEHALDCDGEVKRHTRSTERGVGDGLPVGVGLGVARGDGVALGLTDVAAAGVVCAATVGSGDAVPRGVDVGVGVVLALGVADGLPAVVVPLFDVEAVCALELVLKAGVAEAPFAAEAALGDAALVGAELADGDCVPAGAGEA